MKLGFNPAGANGLHAKIQFNFSGDIQGACFLEIAQETLSAEPGTIDSPDLTVNSPFDIWMDIITGKADGQEMFLDQKYNVEGDLEILMELDQLFGSN
jgi:putative sterol carrier protein